MISIHIPTAIATEFSTSVNRLFILMDRNTATLGYKVLSDLIIDDSYMNDSVVTDEWELMYKRNAKWGDIYTPLVDEHIDVYKLFFKYDINTYMCPITDLKLVYFLKNVRTTTYTRWCIAICKNLWSLMCSPMLCSSVRLICKDILSYMKQVIYTESRYYLDAHFNDTEHINKFKTRICKKRRRLPGGYQ